MLRALEELVVEGPPTLVGFHRALLEHPCFVAGTTCHGVVESKELAEQAEHMSQQLSHRQTTLAAGTDGTRPRALEVEVDGRRFAVVVQADAAPWTELARRRQQRGAGLDGAGTDAVVSPMQGTVLKVNVANGDAVEAGAVICVVEAMKMENEIVAHRTGTVAQLGVAAGEPVTSGQVVCLVESGE
jgi:acetyl-CoA/propionyl-CoA carboxylase biotin carboxyl carrier protein